MGVGVWSVRGGRHNLDQCRFPCELVQPLIMDACACIAIISMVHVTSHTNDSRVYLIYGPVHIAIIIIHVSMITS